ncbi:VOC family protein [Georgenia wangjunii]|uniref:VOC family protein n=1 Tax=Georgenia wangjunii TaxID=3117730 RepID=UPI002F263064
MTGLVIHFEIPFDDKERAKRFYTDVFGWRHDEMPGLDYVGVSTGPSGEDGMPSEPGYIGGGMTARDDINAAPLITLASADIDADLARVTAHGGEVVAGRSAVADMGYAAYFKDSEGNVVGLWESA